MSSELDLRNSKEKKGKLTINMLNNDILNQVPLEALSVVDRYKREEDPEIEKFRRFKEIEDKNKARIKAERRRQNKIKME